MKKRKLNSAGLGISRRPYFKLLARLALAVFLLVLVISAVVFSLKKLSLFNVKDIVCNLKGLSASGIKDPDLSYLKGKNIFNIDLNRESLYISSLYPDYKTVGLVRVLPNRIFVNFLMRKPVAYVLLYRYFYLSDDLVLFGTPQAVQELDLPVILGLEKKMFGPKRGKRYNIPELALAAAIIKELQVHKELSGLQLKKIDVTSLDTASFTLTLLKQQDKDKAVGQDNIESGVLVKIGEGSVPAKIKILVELLTQLKSSRYNTKYIDLRFKEPVIKLIDEKK